MITQLREKSRLLIKKTIDKAVASGKKEFKINFNGGKPETIKDIGNLIVKKKSIAFDNGRSIDVKNIRSILADKKEIIIFVHKSAEIIISTQ